MPQPSFVHLRLHSEFSIVDGIVRLDDAVARAAADGMGALALTDLGNVFGMVNFYKAARKAGIKPIVGCDVWITNDAERDKPHRLLLLVRSHAGYLRPVRAAHARVPGEPASRPRRAAPRVARRRRRGGADRALGRARGRRRRRAAAGEPPGRRAAGARVGGGVPGRVLPRAAARRRAAERSLRRRRARARRPDRPAGGRDAPGAVPQARGIQGARGARLHLGGLRARRPAAAARVHAGRLLQDAGRDGGGVRRPARGARQFGRDRAALQPRARARQVEAAAVPDAGRRHARGLPRRGRREGPRRAPRAALSRRGRARAACAALPRAARVRVEHHHPDGLRGLLPHRRGFHQLGEDERRAGRAGARLRRRVAGRVLARHHRPRSAALRPAVRALPQSRARVDARLRHRLLPGRARPGHRLREAQVRRRVGLADRHLRHDGGEGGGARRRAGAGVELHAHRRAREADPVPAGQADHAEDGARDGAAPRGARGDRGGDARAAGARRGARGPHAQRRHARGRRADRAGQAHRLLPALRRARRRGDGVAARHEGRRGDRAGQVRLPRPDHAHHPRLDAALRAAARSDRDPRPGDASARRPRHLQAFRSGEHDRGVPVRIARHARSAQARASRPLRGHHRAGGAVPARADGPHPRLHRPQARAEPRRVPRPAARADPRADLRDHGVPGAGDADRAGDRRVLARGRRPAAARDGQEEARGDGEAPRPVRRRARSRTASRGGARTSSST